MGLIDLPPEILDLIIDETVPLGLENFALTCKTIYERAGSQITRHNALKRRWKHTNLADPSRRSDALNILYEISREPIIAHYIEFLELWDRRPEDELPLESQLAFRDNNDAMLKIKDMLSNAEFFTRSNLDLFWQELLVNSEEDSLDDNLHAAVALLALLPNIKTLAPPGGWFEVRKTEVAEALVPEVESLVAVANESKRQSRPLGRLETIFPFIEEGYDFRAGLQCLQPFMCLDSIRNLYAVSCVALTDDWSEIPFEWPDSLLQSPLTRVELVSCCMDAGGLAVLLQHAPAITIFRYSHQTKWDGLEYDWNPGEFIETLANYCGPRLKDLAITVDELLGEIINGASSFMRFSNLERLEVDVSPFCGPPLESGQRLGRNAKLPEGAKPWAHIDIPCMGDMLPSSMRELQVNTDHPEPSEQALYSLFKNIKDRREDKLLLLDKVVIRQYQSTTAQKLAADHHMTLEVFNADGQGSQPRSMMPQWKRDFDRIVGGIVMRSEGM